MARRGDWWGQGLREALPPCGVDSQDVCADENNLKQSPRRLG